MRLSYLRSGPEAAKANLWSHGPATGTSAASLRCMPTIRCLLLLVLGLVAGGCSRSSIIRASDYDQSCSVDADCMVLYTGDFCGCGCSTDGINVSERDQVQQDRAAISCGHGGAPQCGPCPGAEAYCDVGRCKTRPTTTP
jgi:hypothetical protein